MDTEPKPELTAQQVSMILQIINRNNFVGEQVEIVADLKRTLVAILKSKQIT